ncbi:Tab2/Atab2 family RNA-binding protein [Acaryochloris sp. 'Moss Beach']|uniref:Tab2/Atab2 family RNA-binding protein n=1 Tax=Acaryochloris sp. 'Moss Beach' TaxID=2740837 RepID=UPI001F251FD3|nr:Tab2/Atab2 family RNA-binding protein [Acaryochloris sp. 'Moss Beach']UJB68082.1 Tab2/Atab2 family RNA-binding protein [Acaryochloris sp. 'Moss Beach']
MTIWQVDFDRRPLKNTEDYPLWELTVYDPQTQMACHRLCPEPNVSPDWLMGELQELFTLMGPTPTQFQVFRPRSLTFMEEVGKTLNISVVATRQTPGLKRVLQVRTQAYAQLPEYTGQSYDPLAIEPLPPQPMPEHLWGDQWQFVTLAASELESVLLQRPIPLRTVPEMLWPSHLGLAADAKIPGVLINGGRRSMQLAQWLQQRQPASIQAMRAELSGLIMAAGLNERYVLVTYDDADIVSAAQGFEQGKQGSQGLHFLLVQPDDSGVTYTGMWLLSSLME